MNIREEVLKRKDECVKDLVGWIQAKGVFDEETIGEGQPFGKDVKSSLDYIYNLAKKEGFEAYNYDGYCVEIVYGDQKESVCVLGHADVVPTGKGWTRKEFGGEIEGDLIYGRGSSDDKGPTLTAFYALKILRDLNVKLNRRVRIIIGGNEERGSACLHHYFKVLKKEPPTYGFTPDADFPLIYGEKGIMSYEFYGEYKDNVIESIDAGEAGNAVPSECVMVLNNDYHFEEKLNTYLKEKNFKCDYKVIEGKTHLKFYGKAAHAAWPQGGENSFVRLLEIVAMFTDSKLAAHFAPRFTSYFGQGVGIDKESKEMGKLTMNCGVAKYDGKNYVFNLNIRYPENTTDIEISNQLDRNVMHNGRFLGGSGPLYVNPQSPFIQTLLKVYQEVTHDYDKKPITIGGGTYARETINTVAYGMEFGRNNGTGNIHSPDEALNINDIIDGMEIYAKAIMELCNL